MQTNQRVLSLSSPGRRSDRLLTQEFGCWPCRNFPRSARGWRSSCIELGSAAAKTTMQTTADLACISWRSQRRLDCGGSLRLDANWEAQLVNALEATQSLLSFWRSMTWQIGLTRPICCWIRIFGAGTRQRYQGLIPSQCRQLLGPHYALLGPEYASLHPLVPARKSCDACWCFGGVDPDNLTGRTLRR